MKHLSLFEGLADLLGFVKTDGTELKRHHIYWYSTPAASLHVFTVKDLAIKISTRQRENVNGPIDIFAIASDDICEKQISKTFVPEGQRHLSPKSHDICPRSPKPFVSSALVTRPQVLRF